jgi:hypothetical protein
MVDRVEPALPQQLDGPGEIRAPLPGLGVDEQ